MLDLFLGSECEGGDQCVMVAKGRNQHNLSVILMGQAHEFTPALIKPLVSRQARRISTVLGRVSLGQQAFSCSNSAWILTRDSHSLSMTPQRDTSEVLSPGHRGT